jgi:hypothetical protein
MFFHLFTICSARVRALVIVLKVRVKESDMGDLSDLESGQIVGVRLAEESVTRTDTLIGVSSATLSKVMSAYTNHGKTISVKRDSGTQSELTERTRRTLRRIVSVHHTTAAPQQIMFPKRTLRVSFTSST